MALTTYTVNISESPRLADSLGKVDGANRPIVPHAPEKLASIKVQCRSVDAARKAAREAVESQYGKRIRALSVSPGDVITVVLSHPTDLPKKGKALPKGKV